MFRLDFSAPLARCNPRRALSMGRSSALTGLIHWLTASLVLAQGAYPEVESSPPRYDPQVAPATHVAPPTWTGREPALDMPSAGNSTSAAGLPLAPPKSNLRGASSQRTENNGGQRPVPQGSLSWLSVLGSLLGVLALFGGGAWLVRRAMPTDTARPPGEVVELLGRLSIGGRQQAQLIRFGNKLLLVSLFPGGAETLSEITDPDEVQRLIGLCQARQSQSASAAFRLALAQFQRAPASGFLAPQSTSSTSVPSPAVDVHLGDDADDL